MPQRLSSHSEFAGPTDQARPDQGPPAGGNEKLKSRGKGDELSIAHHKDAADVRVHQVIGEPQLFHQLEASRFVGKEGIRTLLEAEAVFGRRRDDATKASAALK